MQQEHKANRKYNIEKYEKNNKKECDYKIKNKKKLLITILSILMILLSMKVTYAKYIAIDKISSSTDIAEPIFKINNNEVVQINEVNNIGYYEFSIQNFDETNISETGFLYTIEIISNTDERIKFELYSEEMQIPLKNLKTEPISIIGNEPVEQKYRLKVIYENIEGSNDEILEDIQIKIYSEQEKI